MKIEDILHLQIQAGINNWDGTKEDGMTRGEIEIKLPGGTLIRIGSTQFDSGRYSNEITIHRLNDTRLTVFSKVKKSIKRVSGTIWTQILGVGA